MSEQVIWTSDNGRWRIERQEGKYYIIKREKGNRYTELETMFPVMPHMTRNTFFPAYVRHAITKATTHE